LTNTTVQALAIGNSNPDVVYCGTSQTGAGAGIYKSTDAGGTWTLINEGIQETSKGIQAIAVDPTNPNIAYVAVFDGVADSPQGLYKTTNGGSNWVVSNTGIGSIKNFLSLAINPLNPNVLYCGSSFQVNPQVGPAKIYKSVNGAASWTEASTGLPSLTTDVKPIRCLSISRADTSLVLAGLFLNTDSLGGAYVTTNGGAQWVRKHTGLPNAVGTLVRSCLIRPGSTTEFYVGLGNSTNAGIGVFRTTNAGLSWTDFNGGTLSNTVSIRTMAFRTTSDTTLYAGGSHPTLTSGQGLFEYTWSLTGISNQNIPVEFELLQNYPNPFNPSTTISYSLPVRSFVELKVFDINGRDIKMLVNQVQSSGAYQVKFSADGLATGPYFFRLRTDAGSETKLMLLVK
jgi:hypothetical protein